MTRPPDRAGSVDKSEVDERQLKQARSCGGIILRDIDVDSPVYLCQLCYLSPPSVDSAALPHGHNWLRHSGPARSGFLHRAPESRSRTRSDQVRCPSGHHNSVKETLPQVASLDHVARVRLLGSRPRIVSGSRRCSGRSRASALWSLIRGPRPSAAPCLTRDNRKNRELARERAGISLPAAGRRQQMGGGTSRRIHQSEENRWARGKYICNSPAELASSARLLRRLEEG